MFEKSAGNRINAVNRYAKIITMSLNDIYYLDPTKPAAGETFLPGAVVTMDADGDLLALAAGNVGLNGNYFIVLNNADMGESIEDFITTGVVSSVPLSTAYGYHVFAPIKNAVAVAKGDELTVDETGVLRPAAETETVLFVALEARDDATTDGERRTLVTPVAPYAKAA